MGKVINKKTPTGKGIRTGIQAGVATALLALVTAIWNVPTVPQVVEAWAVDNVLPLILSIGVPAGIVAWLQNRVEQK